MNREFKLRLDCQYKEENNQIDTLVLEIFQDQQWQPLTLNNETPGFLLFINGLFSCQHLYMRTNSAERGLILFSAKGRMEIRTDKNWHIKKADIQFDIYLKSGEPSQEDIDYILGRMPHCPVSSNLFKKIKIKNTLCFI